MFLHENAKAQIAIEYLILTSFLLLASGLIFAYAQSSYTQNSQVGLTKGAVSTIVNAADQTYALGEGSVLFVEIESPPKMLEVLTQYVCKDDYNTVGHQECLVFDPDTECCNAWVDGPLGDHKICTELNETLNDAGNTEINQTARTPGQCFDLFSSDHQELTVKRSYLVFKQESPSGPIEVSKQAHSIIEVSPEANAMMLKEGSHEFRVEAMTNGKVWISLPQ